MTNHAIIEFCEMFMAYGVLIYVYFIYAQNQRRAKWLEKITINDYR